MRALAIPGGRGPNARVFQAHLYLVGVPRPGASVTRGHLTVTINGTGYRGPDITGQKSDTVLRILVLGGSTTFGVGVSNSDTWPAALQTVLDSALAANKRSVQAG